MANENEGGGRGPTKSDIEIVTQMTKAMRELSREASGLAASYKSQAQALAEMCDAMNCLKSPEIVTNLQGVNKNLDIIISNIQKLQGVAGTFSEISENSNNAGRSTSVLSQNISNINSSSVTELSGSFREAQRQISRTESASKKLGSTLKSVAKGAILLTAAALDGIIAGFKGIFNVTRGALGILGSFAKGIFKIGQAILAAPINMFKNLIGMAQSGAGGISELMQVTNDMRKEFGALDGPTNKTITATARNMMNLSIAGTSTFRVFGNLADRMRLLLDLFSKSGPNLRSFEKEILNSNGAILALQRGLGLTEENLEALALRTKSSGGSINKTLTEMTKYSLAMGKRFGLDAKVISREMGKASQDMSHFGHVTEKQMGVAVTYAQKLGIKLDAITGSFDKFSTFDDAAENVSRLNEAFGANIDVGEVMAEQDPTKQFDLIRKGLMKAGVQGEKLTFVQKKMLESFGGMSAETAMAALSTKNASTSLEEIQKEADKTEVQTLSTAEAINKLGDAMERNLKSGSGQAGGFFDKFRQGMSAALSMNPLWIKLMQNIRMSLFGAFNAGKKFGDFILNNFPGVNKILESLTKIFDPAVFNKLFGDVTGALQKFVKDLQTNPKKAMENLMASFKDIFKNFFKAESGPGSGLISGFGEIASTIVKIISGVIPIVMETLTKGIAKLTEFISNPRAFIEKAKAEALAAAKTGGKGARGFMAPIIVAISESWPALKAELDKLFNLIVDVIKKKFEEHKEKIKKFILAQMAISAAFGVLKVLLVEGLKKALIAGFEGSFTGALPAVGKFVKSFFSSALGKVAIVAMIADAAINVSSAMEKFGNHLEEKGFSPATAKVASGMTGLINTITFGMLSQETQQKIAESLAGFVDKFFGLVKDFFGETFAGGLKKQLVGAFDIFAGLGDIIVGIFKSDNEGIEKGAQKIADGIVGALEGAIEQAAAAIPAMITGLFKFAVLLAYLSTKVGPKLVEVFFRVLKAAFEIVGRTLEKIKDSPILRGVLAVLTLGVSEILIALAPAFKKVGEIAGQVADVYKELADTMKGISFEQFKEDISEFFRYLGKDLETSIDSLKAWASEVWKSLTTPFKNAWAEISSWPGRFVTWGSDLWNKITKPFKDSWTWLKENFSFEKFKDIGLKILEGIMEGISKIKEKMKEKFEGAVDGVKKLLRIRSPSGLTKDIGLNVAEGFMEGIKDVPKDTGETFAEAAKQAAKSTSGMSTGAGAPPVMSEKAQVAVAVMKMITDLVGSLASILGGPKPAGGVSNADVDALVKSVPAIMSLVEGLAGRAGKMISSMLDIIQGVKVSFDFNNKIETFGKIIEAIKDIAEASNAIGEMKKSPGKGLIDSFVDNIGDVDNVLKVLSGEHFNGAYAAGPIFKRLATVAATVPAGADASIKDFASVLDSIIKVINSLSDPLKDVKIPEGKQAQDVFVNVIRDINNVLRVLSGENFGGAGSVTSVFESLSKLTSKIPESVNANLSKLQTLATTIQSIATSTTSIVEKGMAPAVKAAEEMVLAAQRLDAALSEGAKIDINSSLKKFTTKFGKGLGDKGAYTVKSKEVVINVNFTIAVDGKKLEDIMVKRNDSIVKQKIDSLIYVAKADATTKESALSSLSPIPATS